MVQSASPGGPKGRPRRPATRPAEPVAGSETTMQDKPPQDHPESSNERPLDYMLRVMRDPNAGEARRDAMAKAALPYLHERISTVDRQASDRLGGIPMFTWKPTQR